jgi:hypothetical protein
MGVRDRLSVVEVEGVDMRSKGNECDQEKGMTQNESHHDDDDRDIKNIKKLSLEISPEPRKPARFDWSNVFDTAAFFLLDKRALLFLPKK